MISGLLNCSAERVSYDYTKCEIFLNLRYNYNLKGENKLAIESRTRTPIEGTARAKVFKVITQGEAPIWDTRAIAEKAGLTTRQVTITRANLRGAGYLPKPTPELTMLTQHTHAATIFPLVKEYREMGLSPREIQLAVKIEKDRDLSDGSVHSAVVYNTRKGNLRRLSKEENHDIRTDVKMLAPEEISRNVIAILELRKRLLENNLRLPTDRLEWKTAAEAEEGFYKSRGLSSPVLTDFNREDINFANRLIWTQFVKRDNVAFFQILEKIYRPEEKKFDNFSPELKMRLEAFVSSIMQEVKERKTDLRDKFIVLGLQFGKEWFYDRGSLAVKEQKFISDKIRNGKM